MNDSFDGPNTLEAHGEIESLSRNQLGSARRLLQRKGRRTAGEFLVEGAQAVREALRAHATGRVRVRLLIVDDPARHAELVGQAVGIKTVLADAEAARQLSDTVTSQGIWAISSSPDADWADLGSTPGLVVICAQVRDPGNAGTVIRCADAFGADAVLLSHGSVELTNPKTVRASVGSVFHLPVLPDADFAAALDWVRGHGLQVLAADATGIGLDVLAASGQLAAPTAWVFGNEAWGLPDEVLATVDQVVSIPMWGQAESLNLSTAAAVCLYASASAQRAGLVG